MKYNITNECATARRARRNATAALLDAAGVNPPVADNNEKSPQRKKHETTRARQQAIVPVVQ